MGSARRLLLCGYLVLALAAAAGCGEDDSEPSGPVPPPSRAERDGTGTGAAGAADRATETDVGGATDEGDSRAEPPVARDPAASDTSASFAPRQHSDSGGGAAQFETRGGDNSIQESGSEASAREFEQAAAALHGYLDARAAEAWAAACGYMASGVVESLAQLGDAPQGGGDAPPPDCPPILAALSAAMPEHVKKTIAEADVGALRVEGDSGYVLFHGAHETDYFMPMARQEGRWKVAALAASPLQ